MRDQGVKCQEAIGRRGSFSEPQKSNALDVQTEASLGMPSKKCISEEKKDHSADDNEDANVSNLEKIPCQIVERGAEGITAKRHSGFLRDR